MIGGHGHVVPRPDGAKARCGGPGICAQCSREAAACRCDGGSYETREHPFLVHPECPIHAAASPVPDRQREAVARFFADHVRSFVTTIRVPRCAAHCSCGWSGTGYVHIDEADAEYRLHVADELLALLDATRDGEQA